jgi:3-dehydroquinate dehydratase/shikimate dehydrogenase
MAPHDQESPVSEGFFKKDMVAMDTVYTPRRTVFLRHAEAAGASTVDGVEMFLRQANGQFRIWTGRPIPTEILKEYQRTL